jgi:hypothetical protein
MWKLSQVYFNSAPNEARIELPDRGRSTKVRQKSQKIDTLLRRQIAEKGLPVKFAEHFDAIIKEIRL